MVWDIERRIVMLRNPTAEDANEWWMSQGFPPPSRPDVPLAAVHKGRLQWLEATNNMLKESADWLVAHGYEPTTHGAPALTPERRDADRIILGKEPLGDKE